MTSVFVGLADDFCFSVLGKRMGLSNHRTVESDIYMACPGAEAPRQASRVYTPDSYTSFHLTTESRFATFNNYEVPTLVVHNVVIVQITFHTCLTAYALKV
jgi:hypothetical protein